MRSRIQPPGTKIPFWTPSKIIFSSVILTLLIVCGSCTIYSVVSFLLQPVSIFPTSIPWIHNESECKHTNRTWKDDACWDYEHGITF
ncbi:hypothetical protein Riv7116_6558 [Rivularia sp. PCC 7116]|uniref:hypothetical protein n=1 Tax=Rivularia sp. PCC 7116 TaxID=373994 RepID=UPI00029EF3EC|nr:hypothetical protein [Rivularia sp. PCC 7116]AFY58886.1 hypothetical protein Riv7116_6558 [Rivularia sp. PCC 7116]